MLLPVSEQELKASQHLQFGLYDGSGTLQVQAGTPIRHRLLQAVRQGYYFRKLDVVEVEHEGETYTLDLEAVTPELGRQSEVSSIFHREVSQQLHQAMTDVFLQVHQGSEHCLDSARFIGETLVKTLTTHRNQIQMLSQIRVRDGYTYSHTLHVAAVTVALAQQMGYDAQELRAIGLAALLHDLGKLVVPRNIMMKPGRLSDHEFTIMQHHPQWGYDLVRNQLKQPEAIARPALEHQENWGGGGYPKNIQGNAIHPYSQIVKVADVYDALTAVRPYKRALPVELSLQIMAKDGEKSFNPQILQALFDLTGFTSDKDA